jgi:hypothetical protein
VGEGGERGRGGRGREERREGYLEHHTAQKMIACDTCPRLRTMCRTAD